MIDFSIKDDGMNPLLDSVKDEPLEDTGNIEGPVHLVFFYLS